MMVPVKFADNVLKGDTFIEPIKYKMVLLDSITISESTSVPVLPDAFSMSVQTQCFVDKWYSKKPERSTNTLGNKHIEKKNLTYLQNLSDMVQRFGNIQGK